MKLFEYENVKLRFTDDALEAIAESALERKIGARGLRMIIEDLMLDLMYQVPNQKKVREVTITREVVEGEGQADHADRESRIGARSGDWDRTASTLPTRQSIWNPWKSTKPSLSSRCGTSSSSRT